MSRCGWAFNYNLSQIDKYRKEHPQQFWSAPKRPVRCLPVVFTQRTNCVIGCEFLQRSLSRYFNGFRAGMVELLQPTAMVVGGICVDRVSTIAENLRHTDGQASAHNLELWIPRLSKGCIFPITRRGGTTSRLLHLFPHWNWPGREGEEILVQVESNLDSVELFLNGKSLGSQKVGTTVPPGMEGQLHTGPALKHADEDGKVVLTETRRTPAHRRALSSTADRNEISADGDDIAIYPHRAVDKDGLYRSNGQMLSFVSRFSRRGRADRRRQRGSELSGIGQEA